MSDAEILTLTQQIEKLTAERDAMPGAGDGGDTPRNATTGRIAELMARRHALQAPPSTPLTREQVTENVKARLERRQLDAALDAELKSVPYQSDAAKAILEEKVALVAVDHAEGERNEPQGYQWTDFFAALHRRGAAGPAAERFAMTARAAGWAPEDALQVFAAVEALPKDPATLPEPQPLSDVEGHHLARAVRALPESEADRLRVAGWFRDRGVRTELVALGRRMRA